MKERLQLRYHGGSSHAAHPLRHARPLARLAGRGVAQEAVPAALPDLSSRQEPGQRGGGRREVQGCAGMTLALFGEVDSV